MKSKTPFNYDVIVGTFGLILCLCGFVFSGYALAGQLTDQANQADQAKKDQKDQKDQKSPTQKPIILSDDDAKTWQPLQTARDNTNLQLQNFLNTAAAATPKTKEEKALLWGDFETTILRSKIEGDAFNAFLMKMRAKYSCKDCEFVLSEDRQKVEFRVVDR